MSTPAAGQQGLVVLAHGGGVPEAMTIGAPVLTVVVFVLLERRARRRAREESAEDPPDTC